MNKSNSQQPENPCIRCCCLDESDTCIGCFRTLTEILNWKSSSTQQKQQIIADCQVRKALTKSTEGKPN